MLYSLWLGLSCSEPVTFNKYSVVFSLKRVGKVRGYWSWVFISLVPGQALGKISAEDKRYWAYFLMATSPLLLLKLWDFLPSQDWRPLEVFSQTCPLQHFMIGVGFSGLLLSVGCDSLCLPLYVFSFGGSWFALWPQCFDPRRAVDFQFAQLLLDVNGRDDFQALPRHWQSQALFSGWYDFCPLLAAHSFYNAHMHLFYY